MGFATSRVAVTYWTLAHELHYYCVSWLLAPGAIGHDHLKLVKALSAKLVQDPWLRPTPRSFQNALLSRAALAWISYVSSLVHVWSLCA